MARKRTDLDALLAADLGDQANRLVLADALEEAGRSDEALLARGTDRVCVRGRKLQVRRPIFELRYVGAPYGEGESGHVVSRHKSMEAAERARGANARYYGSNSRIVES